MNLSMDTHALNVDTMGEPKSGEMSTTAIHGRKDAWIGSGSLMPL